MKYLPYAAAIAALIPSLVHAQNPQLTDCRSLELAGNIIGPDEALVNGLVCKMAKPKTNSALSTPAPGKAGEKSMALLGIIEPEILRSKEKAESNPAGAEPTPGTSLGSQSSDSTASGAPQSPSFEMIPEGSLGDIARAYRKDAGTRVTAKPEEGILQQKKLSTEAERLATTSDKAPVRAPIVELKPAGKTEVSAVAEAPTAVVRPEIIPATPVPALATPAEAAQTAKNEVVAAPQAQPVEVKPEAIAASAASPPAVPAVKTETNLPAVVAIRASTPEAQAAVHTEIFATAQNPPTQAQAEASLAASAAEEAPVPEPERERVVKFGAFVIPEPPPVTNPPPQPVADSTAEESAFQEGQAPSCMKNISLGGMEKERLFLAIPEWALKWYEKNQKRFPGICFSNSLMSGAQNYLVVFYTLVPRVAGAESLKKVSATEEMTPVSGMGSFTTSFGSTWHYTHEESVTPTITSVSAEKAPHNQQTTLLYATAYSAQGIPISKHWPTPTTKRGKETSTKRGKNQDTLLPEFRMIAELLSQMVEDIAKH